MLRPARLVSGWAEAWVDGGPDPGAAGFHRTGSSRKSALVRCDSAAGSSASDGWLHAAIFISPSPFTVTATSGTVQREALDSFSTWHVDGLGYKQPYQSHTRPLLAGLVCSEASTITLFSMAS